jgi:hypothetical protein
MLGVWLLATAAVGQTMSAEEVDFKANFIINLPQYAEWPARSGADATGAVVIGVQGESPLLPALQALAKAGDATGPKIAIKTVTVDDPLTDCQILFMSTKETADLAKILKKVTGKPVLTVSDCEYFARYGVMLNFVKEADKIKFEHNKRTTEESGLKISSKLLKMATLI